MKLFRYVDNDGTGIYEARLRELKSRGEREQLLAKLKLAWELPHPGDLRELPPTQSYFTPIGAVMFNLRHAELLSGGMGTARRKPLTIDRDDLKGEIIYEDPFQVIVMPNTDSAVTPNPRRSYHATMAALQARRVR